MNKKTISVIFLISAMLLSLSYAFGESGDIRYIGFEISKPEHNIFSICSCLQVDMPDLKASDATWKNFVQSGDMLHDIDFGTYGAGDDSKGKKNQSKTFSQKFEIRYSLDTAGTLNVYFSSQNDLGSSSEGNNPAMLESIDGKKLNYNISVNSTMQYFAGKERVQSKSIVKKAFNDIYGNELVKEKKQIDVSPAEEAAEDSYIKTGVVFKKRIPEGGVRGRDIYTLTLKKQNGAFFDPGLYYGNIIVNFRAY